jgi:MFS family permease
MNLGLHLCRKRLTDIILLYVALLALGVAFIIPTLAALVSMGARNHTGAALGQLASANFLGQAGGPVVGGYLFAWRIHAPYLLTALLLLATAAFTTVGILIRPDGFRFPNKPS